MAHGDRNANGRATDLVFHAQHPDGAQWHALCGRKGSIHNPANEGEEVTCRACLKKQNKR